MLQNLSSAAVVIGALRVNPYSPINDIFRLLPPLLTVKPV